MAASFDSATARFERLSPIHWVLPAYIRAQGTRLAYRRAWSGAERAVLDVNQNAGCCIFGHNPREAIAALEALIEAGTPLRLPLARCLTEEALEARLRQLSAQALSVPREYECVLGMRTGAEALDTALAIALAAHPKKTDDGLPLMLIVLAGSFHGNSTRAAFSASAVFRAHRQAASLCEYEVCYLAPDADMLGISAAFEPHDRGTASCVAVIFEPVQHFATLTTLGQTTAHQLLEAAAARLVPSMHTCSIRSMYHM